MDKLQSPPHRSLGKSILAIRRQLHCPCGMRPAGGMSKNETSLEAPCIPGSVRCFTLKGPSGSLPYLECSIPCCGITLGALIWTEMSPTQSRIIRSPLISQRLTRQKMNESRVFLRPQGASQHPAAIYLRSLFPACMRLIQPSSIRSRAHSRNSQLLPGETVLSQFRSATLVPMKTSPYYPILRCHEKRI